MELRSPFYILSGIVLEFVCCTFKHQIFKNVCLCLLACQRQKLLNSSNKNRIWLSRENEFITIKVYKIFLIKGILYIFLNDDLEPIVGGIVNEHQLDRKSGFYYVCGE